MLWVAGLILYWGVRGASKLMRAILTLLFNYDVMVQQPEEFQRMR